MKKYGLTIMRAQPFHLGHQQIINEILLDGKIPIILIGDDSGKDPIRNPLTPYKIYELIKLVYPTECLFSFIPDNKNWTEWFSTILESLVDLECTINEVTLYYYNKECDRYDYFKCFGKEYTNKFYTEIFKDYGIKMKQVEFVDKTYLKIIANATDIRSDLENHKYLLDGRVYQQLKKWGWE